MRVGEQRNLYLESMDFILFDIRYCIKTVLCCFHCKKKILLSPLSESNTSKNTVPVSLNYTSLHPSLSLSRSFSFCGKIKHKTKGMSQLSAFSNNTQEKHFFLLFVLQLHCQLIAVLLFASLFKEPSSKVCHFVLLCVSVLCGWGLICGIYLCLYDWDIIWVWILFKTWVLLFWRLC